MDKGASGHRYGRSFGYGEMMGLVGAGAGGWLYDQPWALVIPWGAMLEGSLVWCMLEHHVNFHTRAKWRRTALGLGLR